MRAVAYCRFSSDMQRDGYSIEAQVSAIKDFCEVEGFELVNTYVDEAQSATTADRDAFQQMIKDSATGAFEYVIVHKLDRFSRDRYDFAVYKRILRENGVRVISVLERLDDSPESIILEGMLEAMAEYYSRNLSRETKKGLNARASKGLACNVRSLGYDIVEGRFVINTAEALIVQEIFNRVITGEAVSSIIRDLDARGIRGTRGGKINYHSIDKIIRNTLYYGDYTFGEDVVAVGAAEPIIDIETWAAANAALSKKKKVYKKHRKTDYLLTGLLYCGLCGAHYTSHVSHSRGYRYERYRCSNSAKKKCNASVIRKEKLEDFVLGAIEQDLYQADFISEMSAQLKERAKKRASNSNISRLKKEYNSLVRKRERLLDLYLDQILDKETYADRANELNTKIDKVSRQLKAASTADEAVSEEVLRAALKYYFETVKLKNRDNLSRLVNSLIERITIYPDKIDIIYKIKDSKGHYISLPKIQRLSCTKGALNILLSAEYRVISYRDFAFSKDDVIKYTVIDA